MTSEVHYEDQGQLNGTYHFKILIPSIAAGAIIGKKGGLIAQLQEETGTKVKMSKATDFYPGTTERVCLISGSVEGILTIHEFFMLKIVERSDPYAKTAIDFDHKQLVERNKQVKILVPNSTAAMIIGKGGNYINQIKEESGAYVQISQNDKDRFTLTERCITVIGEMENNIIACRMILAKIVQDPNSGSCLHVSYASIMGPVPNFDPIGSPFANLGSVIPYSTLNNSIISNDSCASLQNSQSSIMPLTGIRVRNSSFPVVSDPQIIVTFKTMLRNNGYSEQATSEIGAAMNTLANYGLLGLDLGILIGAPVANNLELPIASPVPCSLPPGEMVKQDMNEVEAVCNSVATSSPVGNSSDLFDPADSFRNEVSELSVGSGFTSPSSNSNDCCPAQAEADVFEPFHRTSPSFASHSAPVNIGSFGLQNGLGPESASHSPAVPFVNTNSFGFPTVFKPETASHSAALPFLNINSFGLQTVLPQQPNIRRNYFSNAAVDAKPLMVTVDAMKVDIEADENILRSIYHSRDMTVDDIAQFSGACISITRKAASASGTRSSIITISGESAAINIAQYLLEQRIAREKQLAQRSAFR